MTGAVSVARHERPVMRYVAFAALKTPGYTALIAAHGKIRRAMAT